jgi:adenine-specific DNA-methyltransferase
MQNLLEDLTKLFSKEEKYSSEGRILKNVIIEDALKLEPLLIKLLLSDKKIKKHFFQDIEGTYIFDKIKFQKFISNKQFLPDSYTAFKNKIGLTTADEYITEKKDVVLSWPYKDCVLEGGQDKEDAKRDEIFWNETLAPDEIDRLLSPKVLTNWKKYDKDGEQKVEEVSENDNLIIKGNNLLGLSSILKKYRGKVKLIYIDPPYNTENGGFNYNDSFTHSTWLTFIKNRIEIAKQLLSNDGVLVINSDEIEHSYLKCLIDELFGRENFKGDFIWQKRKGGGNDSHFIALDHDYLTVHVKNSLKSIHEKWRIPYEGSYLERYKEIDEKTGERFYWDTLARDGLQNPIPVEIEAPDGAKIKLNSQKSKKSIEEGLKEGSIRFTESKNGWSLHHKVFMPEGKVSRSILTELGTNKTAGDELVSLFGSSPFKYPKPEGLLRFLINLFTVEKDLVLDFFLGSGTTAAVAHKMNRRYIGVEQINSAENIICERLKKVINGEEGGISKDVNWQGGGSFIFCELAKANQEYIDMINEAKDAKSLLKIWKKMQDKAFISYKVDIKSINENVADFKELPLEDQKRFLIETLDKNMLYVPYSEIDDADYSINDEDKMLNHKFYGGKA